MCTWSCHGRGDKKALEGINNINHNAPARGVTMMGEVIQGLIIIWLLVKTRLAYTKLTVTKANVYYWVNTNEHIMCSRAGTKPLNVSKL